jgi:polygalacturonase
LEQRASADTPFLNFAFPATGATARRTMPDRLTDIINVKDYGAVGDGTTDDTAALLAAINAAAAKGTSRAGLAWKGASVFLPSGQYRITQQLTLPAGVSNCQVTSLTGVRTNCSP